MFFEEEKPKIEFNKMIKGKILLFVLIIVSTVISLLMLMLASF